MNQEMEKKKQAKENKVRSLIERVSLSEVFRKSALVALCKALDQGIKLLARLAISVMNNTRGSSLLKTCLILNRLRLLFQWRTQRQTVKNLSGHKTKQLTRLKS